MADSLNVLRKATELKIREIESGANELPEGRGSQLKSLLLHAVARFDEILLNHDAEVAAVEQAAVGSDVKQKLRSNIAQKYERLGVQVDVTYVLLNTFHDSVGRTDVPIGFQHLLAVVLEELVRRPADPLVHLNPTRMYSTRDIVDLLDDALTPMQGQRLGDTYSGPHPIVFNLPALDPSNALLAPIIAHEVAHSAVEDSLRSELRSRVDGDVQSLAAAGVPTVGPIGDRWASDFRDWCGELICDAVALVAAGPAFALAFASFAPPTATPSLNSHPPIRDRCALHLNILDQLGWAPCLLARLPSLHAWLTEIGNEPILTGLPEEAFLREAMSLVAPEIIAIAKDHVVSPLLPAETDSILDELVASIGDGIPNVEVGDSAATPWQIVLAGWIAAIDPTEPPGEQLVEAVADKGLSELLIKSIELSSVIRSWRTHERASS